jgi:hypothetical protein
VQYEGLRKPHEGATIPRASRRIATVSTAVEAGAAWG